MHETWNPIKHIQKWVNQSISILREQVDPIFHWLSWCQKGRMEKGNGPEGRLHLTCSESRVKTAIASDQLGVWWCGKASGNHWVLSNYTWMKLDIHFHLDMITKHHWMSWVISWILGYYCMHVRRVGSIKCMTCMFGPELPDKNMVLFTM